MPSAAPAALRGLSSLARRLSCNKLRESCQYAFHRQPCASDAFPEVVFLARRPQIRLLTLFNSTLSRCEAVPVLQDAALAEVAALKLPLLPSCRPTPSRQGPHMDVAVRRELPLPALRAMLPGWVGAGQHNSASAHHCCRHIRCCHCHHEVAGWPRNEALLLPSVATGHPQVLTLQKQSRRFLRDTRQHECIRFW